jgi:hypothetical protein
MTVKTFSAGDVWAAAVSFVVVASSFLVLLHFRNPKEMQPFDPNKDQHWNLVLWERDRLQAVAKGLGGAAVAFLSAVFGAALNGNIARTVPPIWIVGCLLGVGGSLLASLAFYRSAERWARVYYKK